jgi:hypothetical protein
MPGHLILLQSITPGVHNCYVLKPTGHTAVQHPADTDNNNNLLAIGVVKSPVATTRPTSGTPSRKRGHETRVAVESEAETSAGKLGSEKWEAGSQSILR